MAMTMYEDSDPFEGMSEEELQQLMDLGMIPGKQDALAQQLAQATAMRNAKGPEGRGYAGVYTAANPLEHLAHAAQGIKAGRDMERIQKEQNDLLQQQTAGRSQFMKAMYGKKPPIYTAPLDPEDFKMPTVNF